jgi:hypothetical protein
LLQLATPLLPLLLVGELRHCCCAVLLLQAYGYELPKDVEELYTNVSSN